MSAFVTNKGGGKLEVIDISMQTVNGEHTYELDPEYDYIGFASQYEGYYGALMPVWCSVINGVLTWDAEYKAGNPINKRYSIVSLSGTTLRFIKSDVGTYSQTSVLYKIKR